METDAKFDKIKPFLKDWRKDCIFKTLASSVISLTVTILFALYNGFLGIRLLSIWHGGICVFYLLLAAIRGIILLTEKNNRTRSDKQKSECRQKTFIISAFLLLLLNLALVLPISLMVVLKKPVNMGLIPAITMAAYTTYKLTMASIHIQKQKRSNHNNILIVELRTIEVHFQAQTTITRKWAEKGSGPKAMSKPGKNNIAYSGFVIPETGELTMTKPGWSNYEPVIQSFREFIKTRPCPDGKKYCMILDNAPWHKKAIRLIWTDALDEYSDIRENMECISLPPYSPDLNPIEQVWRTTRREKTHNLYFSSLEKLTKILDDYFAGFFKSNEQLRSLFSFSCFA